MESSVGNNKWKVLLNPKDRWFNTNISVIRGETINISATGIVNWGPPPGNENTPFRVGPNGTRPPYPDDKHRFPMPDAGCGSLIMRVGESIYSVGEGRSIKIYETGTIQLMVNDDFLSDNSGSFFVNIEIPQSSVKPPDLKLELNELHQTILKKIDDDVESTALGFSNSEAILRDLRVAYKFKTVLDALTGTLNIISEATSIGNLKTSVMGVNSPIEYGGSMMAIQGAYKNGESLAFVFDKNRYSTSVSQMLKAADNSQSSPRFDSLLYTNSIKQSLNGVNGANIIIIPHRNSPELCQTNQVRGTKSVNRAPIKGLGELRRYITAEFQKLENQVAVKNYSSQQTNELIGLIRAAKRSVIESKLRSTTLNLTLSPSLTSSDCKTKPTQISLGRIAANQTVLAAAYDSLNKKLLIEQTMTTISAAGGIVSGVQIFSKDKSGKTLQEILDVSSNALLAVDVGNLALSKVFISKPEEIIAEKPQEMLLALPEEGTSLLLLTDILSQVIQKEFVKDISRNPKIPSKDIKAGTVRKNSIGMDLVYIPPGEFMMGSSESEIDEAFYECKKYYSECKREAFIRETPKHKVTIKEGFWMGKYEVTQAEYYEVAGWKPNFDPTCPNCPATLVSWKEAKEFIQKLNAKSEGFVYSLPTEAEWEYAARAGTTTAFAFGNSLGSSQANFNGNYPYGGAAKEENYGRMVSVRGYQPNRWGLFNMHGNVWEWCEDIYNSSYTNLPVDGSANLSVGDSDYRVLRGGAFADGAYMLRSASRIRSPAGSGSDMGFRIVAHLK